MCASLPVLIVGLVCAQFFLYSAALTDGTDHRPLIGQTGGPTASPGNDCEAHNVSWDTRERQCTLLGRG